MSSHVDSAETRQLLERIQQGEQSARDELLRRHAPLIRRSVGRRLNTKVRARVDPSDVIQETQIDVVRRLDDYLENRPIPFRLWLLKLSHQRLLKVERQHLATAKRSVGREMPLPDGSTMELARHFVSREPTPERQISQQETASYLRRALADLRESDREILLLRNFEQLSNTEAAQLLDLNPETTKKRYARALVRLQSAFSSYLSSTDRGDP